MAKKKTPPKPPYNYDFGYAVYGYKQRRYVDTRKPVSKFSRPCPKCGHRRTVREFKYEGAWMTYSIRRRRSHC